MRIPGHANLAECQRGSKSGAPLAKGYLGGIPPGIFEKYFLLARRDPAKSIVETVLSRKPFFKNLGFSKIWDPQIWQSAREGKKWRPVYYYTPPLAPRGFLQGGRRTETRNSANLKFGARFRAPVSFADSRGG